MAKFAAVVLILLQVVAAAAAAGPHAAPPAAPTATLGELQAELKTMAKEQQESGIGNWTLFALVVLAAIIKAWMVLKEVFAPAPSQAPAQVVMVPVAGPAQHA